MSKPIKRVGDTFTLVQVIAYARGGAVSKGQLRQFDLSASDAAVTGGFDVQNELNVMGNLVAVTTAGLANMFPIAVCSQQGGISDDAAGLWTLEGPIDVAVVDDDVGGDDVDAGDAVSGANATSYVHEFNATERLLGVALEDAAAASDSAADQVDASSHLRRVLWWGGRPGGGCFAPA